jgi:hypothetical protein
MADLPPSTNDSGLRPSDESPPSTPRWVYVFGIIVLAVVVVFVVLHLAGVGVGGHAMR